MDDGHEAAPPRSSHPLIAVCLAPTDLRPEVDPLTGRVRADRRRLDLPANEAAALEHALRIADEWGGSVLAVTAGSPEVDTILAEAVARGAHAVRLEWGDPRNEPGPQEVHPDELAGDPARLAAGLAAAIRSHGEPDVVVCGDRSATHGVGAVPAFLAHYLGAAQALGLVRLGVSPDGRRLQGERRLDGGWRESLDIAPPAVVSVEGAGVRLRRAGLAGTLRSGVRPVPTFAVPPSIRSSQSQAGHSGRAAGDVLKFGPPRPYRPRTRRMAPPAGATRDRLLALTGVLTTREPARIIGPVDAQAAADELLAFLERNGFTLPATEP